MAPLKCHQACFFSKYFMGVAGNFISSSCFACCCLECWEPWHPTAGSRRGLGTEPCPYISIWLFWCQPATATLPAGVVRMCMSTFLALPEERLWRWWEAADIPGGHRHTRVWPLTDGREGDRELLGKPLHQCKGERRCWKSHTSQSSGFLLQWAASPLAQQEPAVTLLLPGSEGHSVACHAGRMLPGKGSTPSLAAAAGSGTGELCQSQG